MRFAALRKTKRVVTLDFVRRWESRPNMSSWEESFARLLRWRDDPEGGKGVHCNVPQHIAYEGHNLGNWLANQRSGMKATTRRTLTEEQAVKLQALMDAGQL